MLGLCILTPYLVSCSLGPVFPFRSVETVDCCIFLLLLLVAVTVIGRSRIPVDGLKKDCDVRWGKKYIEACNRMTPAGVFF